MINQRHRRSQPRNTPRSPNVNQVGSQRHQRPHRTTPPHRPRLPQPRQLPPAHAPDRWRPRPRKPMINYAGHTAGMMSPTSPFWIWPRASCPSRFAWVPSWCAPTGQVVSHAFLDHLVAQGLDDSVGFAVTDDVRAALPPRVRGLTLRVPPESVPFQPPSASSRRRSIVGTPERPLRRQASIRRRAGWNRKSEQSAGRHLSYPTKPTGMVCLPGPRRAGFSLSAG